MPARARPLNIDQTRLNIQQGEPFVSFTPELTSGGFGAKRDLGIVQDAKVVKNLATSVLRNTQSGISVVAREDVREFDAKLVVALSEISPENLQYFLASSTLNTVVADAAAAVTAEAFTLTADPEDFVQLNNHLIDPTPGNITLAAGAIVAEDVGTGDGAAGSGAVSGDFSLDFKVDVFGDVTLVTVTHPTTGVVTTFAAVSAATTGNQVIVLGTNAATSGDLQFFTGAGVATDVTGAIAATYTPGWVFTQGVTDGLEYVIDGKGGRVRLHQFGDTKTGTDELIDEQPMAITYLYQRLDHSTITPFTQFSFNGKAEIELLTSIGQNIIWPIPSATLKLTGTDFSFSKEDYLQGELEFTLNDVGGSAPYGTAEVYSEAQAAA